MRAMRSAEWAARAWGGVVQHHTDCKSVAKCIVKAQKLRKGAGRVLALAAELDVVAMEYVGDVKVHICLGIMHDHAD